MKPTEDKELKEEVYEIITECDFIEISASHAIELSLEIINKFKELGYHKD